jgi:hypothetical protein
MNTSKYVFIQYHDFTSYNGKTPRTDCMICYDICMLNIFIYKKKNRLDNRVTSIKSEENIYIHQHARQYGSFNKFDTFHYGCVNLD